MSEQNKRSRGKINAFDVFVIFLVLCLIGTFVYRLYNEIIIDSRHQGEKYVLYFECDGVYNSLSKYVDKKDLVYIASTGELLGNIRKDDNTKSPALSEVTSETAADTSAEKAEMPTDTTLDQTVENETEFVYDTVKYTGKITLSKDVYKVSDGNYFVLGETNLTVGGILKVYTNNAEFDILITDIAPISEDN